MTNRDPTASFRTFRPSSILSGPLPKAWRVLRARDAYLAENGFTVAEYAEKWTKASFLALDFVVPNTPNHRWGIMLHDLHHVATGFGTDLVGEAEISAWEVRAGLRGLDAYVRSIVVSGLLLGMVIAPRRTLRAWRAARGARALWTTGASYEELLAMSVEELRAFMGVPAEGLATEPRALHKNAPRADAWPASGANEASAE